MTAIGLSLTPESGLINLPARQFDTPTSFDGVGLFRKVKTKTSAPLMPSGRCQSPLLSRLGTKSESTCFSRFCVSRVIGSFRYFQTLCWWWLELDL